MGLYPTIQFVRGMRRRSHRLSGAPILSCQGSDQERRRSGEEYDRQTQQHFRYNFNHRLLLLGSISYSQISEQLQLKHLRSEIPVAAVCRAIGLAPAQHCFRFADPAPGAAA
jgi:hypothetical protein